MSGPQRYRKKPVEIEAMQWTGENADDCYQWAVMPTGGAIRGSVLQCFVPMDSDEIFDTLTSEQFEKFRDQGATATLWVDANCSWLPLQTGEWIAQDRHGFYPIKDDVFGQTYTPVQAVPHGAALSVEAARAHLHEAHDDLNRALTRAAQGEA